MRRFNVFLINQNKIMIIKSSKGKNHRIPICGSYINVHCVKNTK